jgi:hypothetical protein
MGYLFGLESPILQYRGYDREDGGSTCRSISDTLLKNVDKNFQKQLQDYFLKNNTYDGVTLKHEVIDITPEGEVQIFIDSLYTRNETTRPIYNYPTNYLGKYCCEVRFMQYIVPKIESNSAVLRTGKSYFNLPAGTTAFWDDNTQTCRVKPIATPSDSCATTFKIVLNPNGNDGSIFNVGKDDTDCVLNIEFDYLFKYDCAKLGEIAMNGQEDSTSEINILRQQIAQQQVKCEAITQEIDTLNNKYRNTAYSVECTNFASLLTPRTAVIPLDFDIAYNCNDSSRIGITASISNITGGYPPYQIQGTFAYKNQAAALANTSWVNYTDNNIISCYLGIDNWFAIRDSKGNVFTKSIFPLCAQAPTTPTTTTTTTGAGGTSTTNGTTTTTRTPSYPDVETGYIPSPYLPDWEPRIIWYNDPYTRNTTYNYTTKPYVNPITPTRIVSTNNFNNTGFGDITNISPFAFYEFGDIATKTIFCITEPDGLTEWNRILGYVNYQKFINGDPTSYTCEQVATLYKLQETNGAVYLTECTTPFGTKTSIKNQIDTKVKEQTNCNAEIARLNAQLTSLLNQPVTQTSCKTILDALETLDVSFVLDVVESDGSLTTVLEQELFPSIGSGNLYDYLLEKQDSSGFYICGTPNQEELVWADADECYSIIYRKDEFYGPSAPLGFYLFECTGRITMGDVCNVSSCRFTKDMLGRGLYNQSGYDFTEIETFKASLSPKVFSSQWLKYSEVITDTNILETIANKKIKISLKVNNTCSDICVMLDDIKLNKECVNGTEGAVTLTKSPGFNLTKIVDNKKAWNSNTSYVNREFVISNATGGTTIRNTDYGVLDERLVINTKEIDLNMNIASAIETDVWCYVNDNNDILNVYSALCVNSTSVTFSCPNGYTQSPSNDSCYSSSTIAATYSGTMFTAYTGQKFTSYNNLGARFYGNIDNYNFPITLPSGTVVDSSSVPIPIQKTVSSGNTFWANDAMNYSDGRLNDAGVWGTYLPNPSGGGTNYPEFKWIGFTVCIDIPEPKTYYLGLASDNWLRFKINGELIVSFTVTDGRNFNYLHVFPISIPSGPTIIEMEGYNAGSQAAFVAEIYDPNSLEELTASTSTGTTGLIFSTKQMIGSEFLLSVTNGYSCPDGYSLNNCSGGTPVCTSIGRSVISAATGTTIVKTDSCGCGTDCISYSSLTSTKLTNIPSDVNFKEIISTEMIDVKNRKTISKYATLRAFYDKYLQSSLYTTNVSLAYTYDKMRSLTDMVGNYWTDVVEQVIPSTTIWGNTIIYGNTLFDQQKFQYKTGNLETCINGFEHPSNTSWDFLNDCVFDQIQKFYSTCGGCETGTCDGETSTISMVDFMDDPRAIPTPSELDTWSSLNCAECNYSSLTSVADSYADAYGILTDDLWTDIRAQRDAYLKDMAQYNLNSNLGFCPEDMANNSYVPDIESFKKILEPTSPFYNQTFAWPFNFWFKGAPKKLRSYKPHKASLDAWWYNDPYSPEPLGAILSPYTDDVRYIKSVSTTAELPLVGQAGDMILVGTTNSNTGYGWDPRTSSWSTYVYDIFANGVGLSRSERRNAAQKALNQFLLAQKPFLWANNYLLLHPFKKWAMQNATPVTGKQIIETNGSCLPCIYQNTYDCQTITTFCLGERSNLSEFTCGETQPLVSYTDMRRLDFMDDLTVMPSFHNMDTLPYTSGTVDYSSTATLFGKSGEFDGLDYNTYYRGEAQAIKDLEEEIIHGMALGFDITEFPTLSYGELLDDRFDVNKTAGQFKGRIKKVKHLWWRVASWYETWTASTYTTHNKTLKQILPNVIDFKYLKAVANSSLLPSTGNAGDLICVGTPSSYVGYAWDPILNSWSSSFYTFIDDEILTQRVAFRTASIKAKNELMLALRPFLFANEYILGHGLKTWMYGDAKNFDPSTRKGSDVIYNYNNNLPLGLPPEYVITASTYTIPSYTADPYTIIY